MTSPDVANDREDEDYDEGRAVAFVLPSIFLPGASVSWPTPRPAPVQVAIDWQLLSVHGDFSEVHAMSAPGVRLGQLSEIIGRASAAGEQLSLAWIYSHDACRWLAHDRSPSVGFAVRSLAEVTGYYCLSTAHGLANITLRTLLINAEAATLINKAYKKAAGFVPYATDKDAWPPFSDYLIKTLTEAATAVPGTPAPVTELAALTASLRSDPRWMALESRCHEDFHRWRPQSIAGGAAPTNPWEPQAGGGMALSIGAYSRHKPLDPEMLATEASAGLEALADVMSRWLEVWQLEALPALGVPLFKPSDDEPESAEEELSGVEAATGTGPPRWF